MVMMEQEFSKYRLDIDFQNLYASRPKWLRHEDWKNGEFYIPISTFSRSQNNIWVNSLTTISHLLFLLMILLRMQLKILTKSC